MTDLAARYGRSRGLTRRQRLLGRSVGIGVLLLAVVGVWWVATDPASAQLQSRTIGFEPEDDTTIAVTFEVSVDAGTPVRCAVEALNGDYGIVGWIEVDLPPAEAHTTSHRVEVRTSEPAVNGLVSECWVT
ncbi:MAG: DUF4307 domain-containing protein [Agrococcus sp.]